MVEGGRDHGACVKRVLRACARLRGVRRLVLTMLCLLGIVGLAGLLESFFVTVSG